jgi:hypothetical protein
MNPLIIVLICTASFGVVATIAGFVRQIILSRDKKLNDEAQTKALQQQADEFKQMREQLISNRRFPNYEKVLGANKERVLYLEQKMDDIFQKKSELLKTYNELLVSESGGVARGSIFNESNERIKAEIDKKIAFYDEDFKLLQQERASELKNHTTLNDYLLKNEAEVEAGMRDIWKQHASLMAKNRLRSIENTEHVAIETINAGTHSFQSMLMAPINFLIQYFSPSSGASLAQVVLENATRYKIALLQNEMHAREIQAGHVAEPKEPSYDAEEDNMEEKAHSPSI